MYHPVLGGGGDSCPVSLCAEGSRYLGYQNDIETYAGKTSNARGNPWGYWQSNWTSASSYSDPWAYQPDLIISSIGRFIGTITFKDVLCNAPQLGVGAGFDAYAGLGGSGSVGLTFNPRNGQIGITLGVGVGVGIGGGVYGSVSKGPNVGFGKGSNGAQPPVTANVVATASGQLLVGGSGSYSLLGSNKGDWGAAAARGGPDFTANANIGGQVGFNAPAIYNAGC
ncbi:hypothetical protein MMA231_04036 (plasmid) [Asticcacaulis sp. MM231]